MAQADSPEVALMKKEAEDVELVYNALKSKKHLSSEVAAKMFDRYGRKWIKILQQIFGENADEVPDEADLDMEAIVMEAPVAPEEVDFEASLLDVVKLVEPTDWRMFGMMATTKLASDGFGPGRATSLIGAKDIIEAVKANDPETVPRFLEIWQIIAALVAFGTTLKTHKAVNARMELEIQQEELRAQVQRQIRERQAAEAKASARQMRDATLQLRGLGGGVGGSGSGGPGDKRSHGDAFGRAVTDMMNGGETGFATAQRTEKVTGARAAAPRKRAGK